MQQRSTTSLENAGRVAGLLSPAADPPTPAPPASTPTARTYNHLCFFDQFICFGASRSGDSHWRCPSVFRPTNNTNRKKPTPSNGAARQYIGEHLAATHIHVSVPFFRRREECP